MNTKFTNQNNEANNVHAKKVEKNNENPNIQFLFPNGLNTTNFKLLNNLKQAKNFHQTNKKKLINVKLNRNMISHLSQYANINSSIKRSRIKKSRVPFTKEEDELILELIEKHGSKHWSLIASHVKGRTPKQCRDRYSNYLAPGFFKCEWSKEEDELLINLYRQHGPKWSQIKKSFPGRSSSSVKNRWNYFLCRQKHIIENPINSDQSNRLKITNNGDNNGLNNENSKEKGSNTANANDSSNSNTYDNKKEEEKEKVENDEKVFQDKTLESEDNDDWLFFL